jgi:hypothetical protein
LIDAGRTLLESDEETDVRHYMEDIVRDSNIWHGRLVIYEDSVEYFKEHYQALNPQVSHSFEELSLPQEPVMASELVRNANLYTGQGIGIIGLIGADPRQPQPNTWNLQVGWPSPYKQSRQMVYLRVTGVPGETYSEGDTVAVSGVVLASGQVEALDGPGYLDVAFVAGSAIAKFPPDKFNKCLRQLQRHEIPGGSKCA